MNNSIQITRKLQVNRSKVEAWNSKGSPATSADFSTNQVFVMSITNQVGFSFWNSYQTNYPGGIPQVYAHDTVQMILTNANGKRVRERGDEYCSISPTLPLFPEESGPGRNGISTLAPSYRTAAANSFFYSAGDFVFLSPVQYSLSADAFIPLPSGVTSFSTNDTSIQNLPQIGLVTSNWFQAYMVDVDSGGITHVIDYVEFDGPSGSRSVNNELFDHYPGSNLSPYDMWYTNGSGPNFNGPISGVGEPNIGISTGDWPTKMGHGKHRTIYPAGQRRFRMKPSFS